MAINRVGGLASGMDIDALVAKLMSAEKAPLYKLQQQKTKYEWQRDAYRGVNTKLKTYDNYVFDNFRLSSSMGKKTPTVSDTTKVGVTAGAGATGILSIDKVDQLATSARLEGKLTTETTKRLSAGTDSLASVLGSDNPLSGKINFTVKNPGDDTFVNKEIEINTNQSIDQIVTQLQGQGLNASFDAAKGTFSFSAKGTEQIVLDQAHPDSDIAANYGASKDALSKMGMDTTADEVKGSARTKAQWFDAAGAVANKNTKLGELGFTTGGSITINVPSANGTLTAKEIIFKETDTVDSFLKKISSAGATALIGTDGKISITANATGSGDGTGKISFSGNDDLTKALGLHTQKENGDPNTDFISTAGTDAKFTVNGVEMTERSNKVNISGYEITLKQKFDTGPVTIESTADVQGLVDKVKEFVNTYNGLIADLNGQLKEDKYRKFPPLTTEQRETMKENEIKLWEEKAKSGLLRNDSIIREGLANIRSIFSGSVAGLNDKTIDSFSELGITTSNQVSDNGKLIIDENKLRAAIEKDPDQVISIFSNTGEVKKEVNANGRLENVDSRGIAQRMKDELTAVMTDIEKKAGKSTHTEQQYSIGKNMLGLDTRIDRLNVRMVNLEARYWKQFTAMETAINKANSQSGLFSQFSGQ